MNKKTVLMIIKLIPVVSAVSAYILVFSSAEGGLLTGTAVLLAFLGFVFFFIGRKSAKEDKTLKILGILDMLSTVAIILLYVLVFIALAKGITEVDDTADDSYHYEMENAEIGDSIGSFASEDMDGNDVTDAVFAEKDVTILNVWATFCGPCIEEMPELAALAEELPDNAQVIGVVIDTPPAGTKGGDSVEVWGGDPDNIDSAKKICNEAGVKYTNILASDSVMQVFSNVEAVPTTFILDKSGKIICTPFVGADVEGYRKAVEDYLAGL